MIGLPEYYVRKIDSVYEGSDRSQRMESRNWLKNLYHERNNLHKATGDDEDDGIMEAIAKSNNIGAKPKNPIELMALRLKGLYTKGKP